MEQLYFSARGSLRMSIQYAIALSFCLEFNRCFPLASSSFNFDGHTIAYYDATFSPLHNKLDELRLRFKTNYPHGVLFYAKGTQNNDYLSVELRNGSIFVGVDLGSMPGRPGATIMQVGSVLDDYQWHDLAILRNMRNISVKIDQTVVHEESQSAFNGLDLDGKVRTRRYDRRLRTFFTL